MFEIREHIAVGECKQRADNSKHLELAPGKTQEQKGLYGKHTC